VPRPGLLLPLVGAVLLAGPAGLRAEPAPPLEAGTARVDLSDPAAGPVHDPAFAKVLVLRQGSVSAALVTLDVVAVGGIGRIGDAFLPDLRARLAQDPGLSPDAVFVNASHCHATVRTDSLDLVVDAVRAAWTSLVPVRAGAGLGEERRISENRRLKLRDGRETDMRRAYALPPDEAVAAVGPIDPRIGLLRLDRESDGRPLAVVYTFACHPIHNPPGKGSSADFPGYASALLEEALGHGALALFVQGCGGDINPLGYKEANPPADAEPLGNLLGLSTLRAWRQIVPEPSAPLRVALRVVSLPRATDYGTRIAALEAEQDRLVRELRPTPLGFRDFLPVLLRQGLFPDFPSHHAQRYLHEDTHAPGAPGSPGDLRRTDAELRAAAQAYLANLQAMEELTRLNTNLALLRRHRDRAAAAGPAPLQAELGGLRVGSFRLLTFPGELTVEIGLRLRDVAGDPHVHLAGYTNGYLHYLATRAQRTNPGHAQEDCDVLVAPEWQDAFERAAASLLEEF
jgi:hypothetical protein